MGYIRIKAGSFYIDTWALSCQPDLENPFYDMDTDIKKYNIEKEIELKNKKNKWNIFANNN